MRMYQHVRVGAAESEGPAPVHMATERDIHSIHVEQVLKGSALVCPTLQRAPLLLTAILQ